MGLLVRTLDRSLRKSNGEGRALTGLAPHVHLAAMDGGDVLDDAEAEARTAIPATTGIVDAVEPLEDALLVLGADADAVVADADLDEGLSPPSRSRLVTTATRALGSE